MRATYNLDGWWTCVQVDRAVSWAGRYIENRLAERDQQGHALYDLDSLLSQDEINSPEAIRALMAMFGVRG